ncbi:MAG: hypothetical protein QNJ94_12940 [Alphaproteobacteria bacterium]|nr:hypothetical protein [Alphaproteobacteria bacterium]
MIRLGPVLLAVLLLVSPAGLRAEFIEPLGDVPLMPGLTVASDYGVSFDSPSGRIVEAMAYDESGRLAPEAVAAFYAKSLPQLGWTTIGINTYRREGEVLRLELGREGGKLRVRYFLKPG